jgi:hypothetical protein
MELVPAVLELVAQVNGGLKTPHHVFFEASRHNTGQIAGYRDLDAG